MSSASSNLGTSFVPQRPDFWELTNFGTNTLDLTGYRFGDEEGIRGRPAEMFDGLQIGPLESIIFFGSARGVCTNAAQFRAWWGDGNLPTNLQIYSYDKPGLSSLGDVVQIWRVTGAVTTLVDRVQFYLARPGVTFTYNPATGVLDSFSEAGQASAFKAVETDDVGSPGITTGSVPLAITMQPQTQTVDAGAPVTFNVRASGLPKPRFQWRLNGVPITGATSNVFEIPATQPTDAGAYTVELANGVVNALSDPALLQINTIPSPPSIVVPPADLVVTPGQAAIFHVSVRGYPLPNFQWQFNGENLFGATAATLKIFGVNFNSSGVYSVRIWNTNGLTNTAAVLTVRAQPNLVITEMMGSLSTNTAVPGGTDWWELTNFDANAVNLRGYRFNDSPGVLEGAVVIAHDLIIQPGESVLFIQATTPDLFTSWWGEENLPENAQFVRYRRNGIKAEGDSMTLWNATALDDDDFITQAEYVHLNSDSTPMRGISRSFWCDGFVEFGEPSVMGVCGTIKAAGSEDIGSPGYVVNHPPRIIAPSALKIFRDAQDVHLTWKTQAGKRYELLSKDSLDAVNWTPLSQHAAPGAQLTITDTTASGAVRRFYRLRVVPGSE
jgi:hypothetical protein